MTARPRAELVAFAADSIARGSKSFRAASRLFDRETRERAWLLYAWCRAADDIVDGQDHGGRMAPVADPARRLAEVEALTAAALAGAPVDDPAFQCLALVTAECALPHGFVEDVIAGFALDAGGWRPETADDLLAYCYHVAGAVGCLMAIVMGVSPTDEALIDRASDLGLAFQLANIARDVAEDAAAGRCYLPGAWLTEVGVAREDAGKPAHREAIARLTGRLAAMASHYEASARAGAARLPLRSAWAVLAAAGIYGAIGRKVARSGVAALDRRVSTGKLAKLGWFLRAGGQSLLRTALYPDAPRDPALWVRPGR